jgi:hypothetical protein
MVPGQKSTKVYDNKRICNCLPIHTNLGFSETENLNAADNTAIGAILIIRNIYNYWQSYLQPNHTMIGPLKKNTYYKNNGKTKFQG